MNVRVLKELLERAITNSENGISPISATEKNEEISGVLDFLVLQRWFEVDKTHYRWKVTPLGRLWFSCWSYAAVLQSYDYHGTTFLLQFRSDKHETIVWGKGKFATISIPLFSRPECLKSE